MSASSLWNQLLAAAQAEVRVTVRALPEHLRRTAEGLPVTYERYPSRALIEDGLAEDTLGLFVGEPHELGFAPGVNLPAQIILFLENLWDFAEGDWDLYREEVRTTLLHELGHYLGLDEDDLGDRGLE